MTNLESFDNFKNEEVENTETLFGGDLIRTTNPTDFYDSELNRMIYCL